LKPHQSILAGIGLIAFVALMPPWIWFVHSSSATESLSLTAMFMADLSIPAVAALFVASWFGGA